MKPPSPTPPGRRPDPVSLQDAIGLNYAKRLGVVLILGVAALLVLAARDKGQRAALESFSLPTALGDQEVFMPSEPLDLQKPVASFQGKPLFPTSLEPDEVRESRLTKAGRADTGAYYVYRHTDPKKADKFFLKVSPGRFLVVAPR